MFYHESWKSIYFGVKRSKVEVTSHNKHCLLGFLHSCECWLVLVTNMRPPKARHSERNYYSDDWELVRMYPSTT